MTKRSNKLEELRTSLQADLDQGKSQLDRNRLGQFSTPIALAQQILSYAASLHPSTERVRFLDPAFGTGAFYSALQGAFPERRIGEALGFEIDQHYGGPAANLWKKHRLSLRLADFTREYPSPTFNLIICNPPYVRHHHLRPEEKERLQQKTHTASGMRLSGLAGLYCHFLGISHAWMAKGAIAGWLIPSEFMDVNYGEAVKRYLVEDVTLLRIHRFDPSDVQFADALVSSVIVWFRNALPPPDHGTEFTLGGTLTNPRQTRTVPLTTLAREHKWTRFPVSEATGSTNNPTISDFFHIKRGIATGDNSYFILDAKTIHDRGLPRETFQPVLPSPRYLLEDEVAADNKGNPFVDRRLFVLDTKLDETTIKSRYPALWSYLQDGKARGIHQGYLCSHRKPWYAQESRPPAPIVCTYLGRADTKRGRPFRFILNESLATVANVYLAMYPKPLLMEQIRNDPTLTRKIWRVLNELPPEQLLGEGRVYGGGLHKLEPKELGKVNATVIAELIPAWQRSMSSEQPRLFDQSEAEESSIASGVSSDGRKVRTRSWDCRLAAGGE